MPHNRYSNEFTLLTNFLGYTSTAARGLQQKLSGRLRESGLNVHSRVLGNVIYLMASLTSRPESLREIEGLVRAALAS